MPLTTAEVAVSAQPWLKVAKWKSLYLAEWEGDGSLSSPVFGFIKDLIRMHGVLALCMEGVVSSKEGGQLSTVPCVRYICLYKF